MKGANRFVGVKSIPGVQVLLTGNQDQPLLVAGEYGSGRVLAFAGDSTWQWWRKGQQSAHKRFWRQTILWLAQREDVSRGEVWVDLPLRRFLPGNQVEFTAGARTPTGDPITDVEWIVQLKQGDDSQPITLSANGDLFNGSSAELTQPGDYVLDLVAQQGGRRSGERKLVSKCLIATWNWPSRRRS